MNNTNLDEDLLVNTRLRIRRKFVRHIKRPLPFSQRKIYVTEGQPLNPNDLLGEGESSAGFTLLELAKNLGVPPGKATAYLTRKMGQYIYKGEILAQKKGILNYGQKIITSPSDGLLDQYDEIRGTLRLKFIPRKIKVASGVFGVIDKINEVRSEVIIRTLVDEICGVFGSGGERSGILRVLGSPEMLVSSRQISPSLTNQIVVGGSIVFVDALQRAVNLKIHGIITGGINASDYKGMAGGYIDLSRKKQSDVGLSLVATEGFGTIPIGKDIFQLFTEHQNQFCIIDGNAGRVILPINNQSSMIYIQKTVLPADYEADHDFNIKLAELKVGSKVRVISSVFMGSQGEVIAIDKSETQLPSKISTRMITVVTPQAKVSLPYSNLEIMI